MRWILVEATQRVLPEIDASLADYAVRELRGRGIEVRLGTTIDAVSATDATLSTGETMPTRTVVWTAECARSRACAISACRSTSAAGSGWTTTCASRAWTASGPSAIARPCRTPRGGA